MWKMTAVSKMPFYYWTDTMWLKSLNGRDVIKRAIIELIGSMSPWVLPERTLGTVWYTETYPGNYLICRTIPCLLSTVPWLSLFRPLLMSQYLKYTCTDRQASYLYKVGLEYETVKPRRNFNLYTLIRAILLQISRWSGMRGLKTGYGLE